MGGNDAVSVPVFDVEAQKLGQILPAEAKGVILNPLGVNMPLNVKRVNPAGGTAAVPQSTPAAE